MTRSRTWVVAVLANLTLAMLALGARAARDWTVDATPTPLPTRPIVQRAIVPADTPAPIPELPTASPTATPSPAPAPPPAGLIVVADEEGQSLVLVDAATNQVTRTIHLGVPAHGVVVSPDGRTAWVFSNRRGASEIYFVDLEKGERTGAVKLRDAPDMPYGVAFSADGSRAFVPLYEASSVSFVDAVRRSEIGRLDLGRQTPGVDIRRRPHSVVAVPGPAGEILYISGQGSGVAWALDAGSGQLLAEIEVGGGPTLLLPDPDNGLIHVLVDTIDQLVSIETSSQQIVGRIGLPGPPASAAIGPGGVIYVTAAEADEVWVIEPGAQRVGTSVAVGARPVGVAFSADGGRAYVANRGDGTLSVIDVPTRKLVDTVSAGRGPVGVAFATPDRLSPPSVAGTGLTPSLMPGLAPTPTPLPRGTGPERLPPGTVREVFVPNAEFPAALAFAPDGRLFYGELRTGRIRIVENGNLLADPFYDFSVAGQPETGLLGLAIDPDFARNGYVYVFYTEADGAEPKDGGANGPNHVVRLTEVNGKGTDLTPILPDLPSGPIHNGGSLRFGPDGKLYVTLGETGEMSNAQDLQSPAGKILRLNPDGSIPDDNPFAGQTDKHGAIWAYGLRNSFDLDFHPVSGLLFASENGPGDSDEMNLIVQGGDFGWPPSGYQNKPDLVDPVAVFNPVIAPVGVEFYAGEEIPEWENDLFYCTFHEGALRRVHLAPTSFDRIVLEEIVTSGCTLDVVNGPDGALYFSDLDTIYRIRAADRSALPAVVMGELPERIPTPSSPSGIRTQDRDINVTMTEWKLEPSRSVAPAGRIRFLVENLGNTAHAMQIVGNGIDASTEDFGPGESRLLEVELPPGTYELICPVGGHDRLGMVTTLTVEEP